MFFDLLLPPPTTLRAQQSRVPVNLSSNPQDKNDLIADQLYNQIKERIKSDEIDSEVNIRSQKIISEVEKLDIGDKRKILEKLQIKLNEYFNQKYGEINRTQDESIRGLLRIGFNARINICKNFEESIAQQSNSSILAVDSEVNGGSPASREVNGGNESQDPSILPELKQFVVVDKRSESLKLELKYFEQPLQDCTNSRSRTKDNFSKNEFKDYETKENKIKDELLKMKTSQDPKDKNFFKNYLDKYLELIKLYEDSKKVMIEKFKEAGKDLELVDQEFNQLENEARNECLDFLLANSPTLQNLKSGQLKDNFEERFGQNHKSTEQLNQNGSSPLVSGFLSNELANLKTRPKNPARPSDPVAEILKSESRRGNRLRIHSGRPTP